jgi:hypothetical protein
MAELKTQDIDSTVSILAQINTLKSTNGREPRVDEHCALPCIVFTLNSITVKHHSVLMPKNIEKRAYGFDLPKVKPPKRKAGKTPTINCPKVNLISGLPIKPIGTLGP